MLIFYCKIKLQFYVNFTTLAPEHSVRNRNGKESLTEETLAQSFENSQLAPMKIPALIKEGICMKHL